MKRVLIMEDNVQLARDWQEEFEQHQVIVEVAFNGDDAERFLNTITFDLVITDLFVATGKGGLHVLGKLLMMGRSAPPAIAVTGSYVASGQNEQGNLFLLQAKKLGSSMAIQKPFQPAELWSLAQTIWQEAQDI